MKIKDDLVEFARRVSAATPEGVVGLVAGKVKTRDQVLSAVAVVLVGVPLIKTEGLVVGLAAALTIALGCGLLIRLWKWRMGTPRGSSDY